MDEPLSIPVTNRFPSGSNAAARTGEGSSMLISSSECVFEELALSKADEAQRHFRKAAELS